MDRILLQHLEQYVRRLLSTEQDPDVSAAAREVNIVILWLNVVRRLLSTEQDPDVSAAAREVNIVILWLNVFRRYGSYGGSLWRP